MDRQAADIATLRRDEDLLLPETLAYEGLPGLSNELKPSSPACARAPSARRGAWKA